jgi:hypothetical protein
MYANVRQGAWCAEENLTDGITDGNFQIPFNFYRNRYLYSHVGLAVVFVQYQYFVGVLEKRLLAIGFDGATWRSPVEVDTGYYSATGALCCAISGDGQGIVAYRHSSENRMILGIPE